jgi:hypothetical protein
MNVVSPFFRPQCVYYVGCLCAVDGRLRIFARAPKCTHTHYFCAGLVGCIDVIIYSLGCLPPILQSIYYRSGSLLRVARNS